MLDNLSSKLLKSMVFLFVILLWLGDWCAGMGALLTLRCCYLLSGRAITRGRVLGRWGPGDGLSVLVFSWGGVVEFLIIFFFSAIFY